MAHTAVLAPWSCRGQKCPKTAQIRGQTPAPHPQPEVIHRRVAIFRFLCHAVKSAGPHSQTGAGARHCPSSPAPHPPKRCWKYQGSRHSVSEPARRELSLSGIGPNHKETDIFGLARDTQPTADLSVVHRGVKYIKTAGAGAVHGERGGPVGAWGDTLVEFRVRPLEGCARMANLALAPEGGEKAVQLVAAARQASVCPGLSPRVSASPDQQKKIGSSRESVFE